jgi:hypothetical protein
MGTVGMEVERMEIKTKTHELEVLVRLRAPGNTPAEALHNVVGTLVSSGVELAGPVEWSEAPGSIRDPQIDMMAEIAEVVGAAGILVGPFDPDTWN